MNFMNAKYSYLFLFMTIQKYYISMHNVLGWESLWYFGVTIDRLSTIINSPEQLSKICAIQWKVYFVTLWHHISKWKGQFQLRQNSSHHVLLSIGKKYVFECENKILLGWIRSPVIKMDQNIITKKNIFIKVLENVHSLLVFNCHY